ncbi:MAG: acetate--CoA ligase family protein [Granulosicoccus sp.]|nr:acetate--CoA ligase family protein [Granulosicoccus sp.]
MSQSLQRLLRPGSIAVLGGAWAHNVVEQCLQLNYSGDIWPVHPSRAEVHGLHCYASVQELPAAPDATFVGINRFLTIDVVAQLARMGAGGVVCFASGYSEATAEDEQAAQLHEQLLAAAGEMPLIGPNCYGMINYLDGALLWPDQHGGKRVERGVALITQSSNIAINLTMQTRGLPIAYVLTAGNQAQQSLGDLGTAILSDNRVTALGLHVEGFGDLAAFERMAAVARQFGKPVVVVKAGRSVEAQKAMISHTNSLSGSDHAASAFLQRLGMARVQTLSELIETLKLLHVAGPLSGTELHSMSCSGGEASMMADAAVGTAVTYPPLTGQQQTELRTTLGSMVALANPLDYHTFIWDDIEAMTATFSAVLRRSVDLSVLVIDFPRGDRCTYPSWNTAVDALVAASRETGARVAILASLPENLPETMAISLIERGVVPLSGIDDAMVAVEAAGFIGQCGKSTDVVPVLALMELAAEPATVASSVTHALLKRYSVSVPVLAYADTVLELEQRLPDLNWPVVLKGTGLAHKTESDAVKLNLRNSDELLSAAREMEARVEGFQVDTYIPDAVVEMLVSIVRDPIHGFMLTLAAGGIRTELMADAVQLLLPTNESSVRESLKQLKLYPLLVGFRGRPGVSIDALVFTVMRLQQFALDHAARLSELEINPLLCREHEVVAVDALLCMTGETNDS